jgi:hypothetical protein
MSGRVTGLLTLAARSVNVAGRALCLLGVHVIDPTGVCPSCGRPDGVAEWLRRREQ